MKSRTLAGGLVYSTDGGRMCPSCRRPIDQCACTKQAPIAAGDGIAVSEETSLKLRSESGAEVMLFDLL